MNMISRIALKIARQYLADEQDNDIYDLKFDTNFVHLIMQDYKHATNQYYWGKQYDISDILTKIIKFYKKQQDYKNFSNTKIQVAILTKSWRQLAEHCHLEQNRAKQIIDNWLPGQSTGQTKPIGGIPTCAVAAFDESNGKYIYRSDRAIAKTLRHEIEHACQIILDLQDEEVKDLNEDKNCQYFQTFADFSRKREVGRYLNDMLEDFTEYNLQKSFFFDFAEQNYDKNIDEIFSDVSKISLDFIQQNNLVGKLTNQDIANDLLFLCSLRKYRKEKFQSIKRSHSQ